MKAWVQLVTWELRKSRKALVFLGALALVPLLKASTLSSAGAVGVFWGSTQLVLWGGGAVLLIYGFLGPLRDARSGRLAQLVLSPRPGLVHALARLAATWLGVAWITLLSAGANAMILGRFFPEAPGELLRLSLYTLVTLGLPLSGLFLLAGTVGVAYELSRAGLLVSIFFVLGALKGLTAALVLIQAVLGAWGGVWIGSLAWSTAFLANLGFSLLNGSLPLMPLVIGPGLALVFALLAGRILEEVEL